MSLFICASTKIKRSAIKNILRDWGSPMGVRESVSVIVPAYNGEAYISATLTSIVPELIDGDELIVVGSALDDNVIRIVRHVAPSAVYLPSENLGVSVARNVGLRTAQGRLIAFLDCDDLWPRGRQTALRSLLDADKSLHAAAGRIRIQVESGGKIGDLAKIDGAHAPSILMSCLYRREMIDRVGFFGEDLRYGEDLDYYWRLVENGMQIALSEHYSLIYRRHPDNVTNSAPPRQLTIMKLLSRRAARNRDRELELITRTPELNKSD